MRGLMVRAVVVILTLGAGLLVGVAAGGVRAAAATDPVWSVSDRLAMSSHEVATACGDADCWAVTGGRLLHSADVGATWVDRTASVPSDVRGLADITCRPGGCLVTAWTDTAAEVLVLAASGIAVRPVPGAAAQGLRIACATVRQCLLTDGTTTYRTADGGTTWAAKGLPSAVPGAAVSCAGDGSVCVVVGARGEFDPVPVAYRTRDGGRTWQALTFPSGHRRDTRFDDVACSSAALCRLVGYSGSRTVMLSTTSASDVATTEVTLPRSLYEIRSLACTSATVCTGYAQGTNGEQRDVATNDGVRWTSSAVDPAYLQAPVDIGCVGGNRCVAAIPGVVRNRAADGAWRDVSVPAAVAGVTMMSCATVAQCVGIGYDAANRPVALRGRPGAWRAARMPAAVGRVDAVDCATPDVCTVLTQFRVSGDPAAHRRAWRSVDGGLTWVPQPLIGRSSGFNMALRCPTTSSCLALGVTPSYEPDLLRTVDGGATWTHVAAPEGARDIRSVACPSAGLCLVVGHRDFGTPTTVWRTTDTGATFARQAVIGGSSDSVLAIACPSAVCVATAYVDNHPVLLRSPDRGRTWTAGSLPTARLTSTSGLACSAGGRCVALVDVASGPVRPLLSTDAGATWTLARFEGGHPAGPVGCLDTGCFAVGYDSDRPVVLAEPV